MGKKADSARIKVATNQSAFSVDTTSNSCAAGNTLYATDEQTLLTPRNPLQKMLLKNPVETFFGQLEIRIRACMESVCRARASRTRAERGSDKRRDKMAADKTENARRAAAETEDERVALLRGASVSDTSRVVHPLANTALNHLTTASPNKTYDLLQEWSKVQTASRNEAPKAIDDVSCCFSRDHVKETAAARSIRYHSIEQLLADEVGLRCFHEFLKSEFSEENVEFWIACEEYKNISQTLTQSSAQCKTQAVNIFSTFVAYNAPKQINIDSQTRERVYESVLNPSANTFDEAQKKIQALMDRDSHPRFLQSDIYQRLLLSS